MPRSRSRPAIWIVVLLMSAAVLAGATGLGIAANRSGRIILPGTSAAGARDMAQQFLRGAARRKTADSCLAVCDNGSIINPCLRDLRAQAGYRELSQLSPTIRVTQVHLHGSTAEVSSDDLVPRPDQLLSLRLDRTEDGWRVRALNDRAIHWTAAPR